ncbi:MAG: class I SAM-dependent methyltransferase [Bryobacteraceae bacterium]
MLRISNRGILFGLVPLLALTFDVCQHETNKLADLMNWRPGQVIAEIGAGEGQMTFAAAARVGPAGHVYTTELDAKKLADLQKEVRHRKLENVSVVKAETIDTNLPENCCDGIFMRRVYHHFEDPAQTDASIFRALKPGGLLAVIDFAPRQGLPPVEGAPKNHAGHGIVKDVLIGELRSAGFEILTQQQNWPDGDYCVIARKPGHS